MRPNSTIVPPPAPHCQRCRFRGECLPRKRTPAGYRLQVWASPRCWTWEGARAAGCRRPCGSRACSWCSCCSSTGPAPRTEPRSHPRPTRWTAARSPAAPPADGRVWGGQTDGWMDEWEVRWVNRWTGCWWVEAPPADAGGWTGVTWADGRMDGWMGS